VCPEKKEAMAYIVKGLTHQFRNSVRHIGLVFLLAFITEPKSIFTMMGYIIKKRQTAMGIETIGAPFTEMAKLSSFVARFGATFPSKIPPIILSPTQTVR